MAITFVSQSMNNVTTALQTMGTNAGALVQADIRPLFISMAVLALVLGGYGIMTQRIRMNLSAGLGIALRIAVVAVFVESWSNYSSSFATLTDFPSEVGGIAANALGGTGGSIGASLDDILTKIADIATALGQNGGYFSGPLNALFLVIVGLLFAAIGVFVVISAQLMLAVMLIVGPVAVTATLNEKLSFLFTAWIKSTITAALIQMLAVIVIAVTSNAMQDAMPSNYETVSSMGAVMGVIFIGIVGVAFMAGVPGIAASLAGGGVQLGSITKEAVDRGNQVRQRAFSNNASKSQGSTMTTGASVGQKAGATAAGLVNRLRGLD